MLNKILLFAFGEDLKSVYIPLSCYSSPNRTQLKLSFMPRTDLIYHFPMISLNQSRRSLSCVMSSTYHDVCRKSFSYT